MGSRNHFLGSYFSFTKLVVKSLMGSRNHFLDPYFSFTKVLVISLMGSRNHFLGPYFSFAKVVVISLMGSRNHFLGPYFSFATCRKWFPTEKVSFFFPNFGNDCHKNDFLRFGNDHFLCQKKHFHLEMIFSKWFPATKSHFLLFFAEKNHLFVWKIIYFNFGND